MTGETPTLQTGAEAAAAQQAEGALRHMAGAAVRFAVEAASTLLTPYSHSAEASVEHAQPDRRAGDRVNRFMIPLDNWVNTDHRT